MNRIIFPLEPQMQGPEVAAICKPRCSCSSTEASSWRMTKVLAVSYPPSWNVNPERIYSNN